MGPEDAEQLAAQIKDLRDSEVASFEHDRHRRPHPTESPSHGGHLGRRAGDYDSATHGPTTLSGHQRAGIREGDQSFEYTGTDPYRQTDNIFSDSKEQREFEEAEEVKQRHPTKFTRNLGEGGATGKFGGSDRYHQFGDVPSPHDQQHLEGHDDRENYIKRKAEENRKNRLKQYLSGDKRDDDILEASYGNNIPRSQHELHKDTQPGRRNKYEEELKKEIDRRYNPEGQSLANKSIHDQPFEGQESRIGSKDHTFEHDRHKDKSDIAHSDSKQSFSGLGKHRMIDDRYV